MSCTRECIKELESDLETFEKDHEEVEKHIKNFKERIKTLKRSLEDSGPPYKKRKTVICAPEIFQRVEDDHPERFLYKVTRRTGEIHSTESCTHIGEIVAFFQHVQTPVKRIYLVKKSDWNGVVSEIDTVCLLIMPKLSKPSLGETSRWVLTYETKETLDKLTSKNAVKNFFAQFNRENNGRTACFIDYALGPEDLQYSEDFFDDTLHDKELRQAKWNQLNILQ